MMNKEIGSIGYKQNKSKFRIALQNYLDTGCHFSLETRYESSLN